MECEDELIRNRSVIFLIIYTLIAKGNLWNLCEWMKFTELKTINGITTVDIPGYNEYLIFL